MTDVQDIDSGSVALVLGNREKYTIDRGSQAVTVRQSTYFLSKKMVFLGDRPTSWQGRQFCKSIFKVRKPGHSVFIIYQFSKAKQSFLHITQCAVANAKGIDFFIFVHDKSYFVV